MAPKAAASASKASGAAGGGGGPTWWKRPELMILFQKVEKVLPLGEYQWIHVAEQYNDARPQGTNERTWESCRNKFKDLKNKKKPTGEADCPWEVKEAKRLQKEIETKMCTATMDDPTGSGEGSQQGDGSDSSSSDSGDEKEGGEAAEGGESGAGGKGRGGEESRAGDEGRGGGGSADSAGSSGQAAKKKGRALSPVSPAAAVPGTPARLGLSTTVQSTATSKRHKLDKQIEQAAQQRSDSAESRNTLLSTMMMQQQQANQQNQQMQMMMMMMMSKMIGVPLPNNPPPPPPNAE